MAMMMAVMMIMMLSGAYETSEIKLLIPFPSSKTIDGIVVSAWGWIEGGVASFKVPTMSKTSKLLTKSSMPADVDDQQSPGRTSKVERGGWGGGVVQCPL